MASKPYGQINYEAYCEESGWVSKFTGDPLPQWKDQDAEVKKWWEAGAQAVLHVHFENQFSGKWQTEPTRGPSA